MKELALELFDLCHESENIDIKNRANEIYAKIQVLENRPINKFTFIKHSERLHKSLVDANLDDNQFDLIWQSLNEFFSELK